MYYKVKTKDFIRLPPDQFSKKLNEALTGEVRKKYDGYISKELGLVIDVDKLHDVGEGIIIPGDGASYFETTFDLITFIPELQEVVYGSIKDIADFGAFMSLGPIDGMIHISQAMNDFVSFAKDKTLAGKDTKRTLHVGDVGKARIIAVSYKDITNPKLGLTMRQPGLGKEDWIAVDLEKKK
ncbi:DNA-directed RNA polymerase [Candidatus Woesearchaeota archaeon]|nr:DNA-directed RNA polymerase [Candidatus Woesearchaeota archaeon]